MFSHLLTEYETGQITCYKPGQFICSLHPEFYTLPNAFIRQYHNATSSWQKVRLKYLESELTPYADEAGFEQIAQALGIAKPVKSKLSRVPGPQPSS